MLLTKKILDTNLQVRGGRFGAGATNHGTFNNRLFVTVSHERPFVRLAVDLILSVSIGPGSNCLESNH